MSVTPDLSRKVGSLMCSSPSPFLTPRSERRRTDPRSIDWNSHRMDRDREVNVQVILRCRPSSEDEQRMNFSKVISCNEQKKEVTVLQSVANKHIDRVFTFDKVFGPKAQQRTIYDQTIVPIVNEVLEGFNCTVFAYGQTGTGKTYTMEGGMKTKGTELPAEAGVIPRAVRQIFDTLEAENADYNMKVTFLELYNEEITDLLVNEDSLRSVEDRQKKPITLMEDGKGSVILRGLEEESVYSACEIYKLLERGAAKRRTSDTSLNKHSSRSHSIFSITVYIKESSVGNEELVKCGKLNLVDLAGSENVSRSGAREVLKVQGRLREAGEINKSLLTLGRVINALVDHSVHIPYRDSKLTRLLRDSLGGKTKTCIIATVSPTAYCLEETLSTLDYAYRAKNIKNKPEANQKVSKAVLLKDLFLEMDKMKLDVRAAREKNGVYIPHERFEHDEAEKKVRNVKIEQLEINLASCEKETNRFRDLYYCEQEEKQNLEDELNYYKINLEKSNKDLHNIQENYRGAVLIIKEKESIIARLFSTENCLIDRTKGLCVDLKNASDNITTLSTKIDQKCVIEAENQRLVLEFGSQLDQSLKELRRSIMESVSQQQEHLKCVEENFRSFIASKCDTAQLLESKVKNITETYTTGVLSLNEIATKLQQNTSSDTEKMKATVCTQTRAVECFLKTAMSEVNGIVHHIHGSLGEEKQLLTISTKTRDEALKQGISCAQEISNATVSFFEEIHHHSSRLMTSIQEIQNRTSRQLSKFEHEFKKMASLEEEVAMRRIGSILRDLTLKKIDVVSETSKNIQSCCLNENALLQQEVLNVQKIASTGKMEIDRYIANANAHYIEDAFSSVAARGAMEETIAECSSNVEECRYKLENAISSLSELNNCNFSVMESMAQNSVSANKSTHEDFMTESASLVERTDDGGQDLLQTVKNSLMLDHEIVKEVQSISNLSSDQLDSIREQNSMAITHMRKQAEQSLVKDYLVDLDTPLERSILVVPSLDSIEELRTKVVDGGLSKRVWNTSGSPNRTPFTEVNWNSAALANKQM